MTYKRRPQSSWDESENPAKFFSARSILEFSGTSGGFRPNKNMRYEENTSGHAPRQTVGKIAPEKHSHTKTKKDTGLPHQKAISSLRRISGLTWEQLAYILGVSRRSLHSWANGGALNVRNAKKLQQLLATVRYVDKGFARLNRESFVEEPEEGSSVLELLKNQQYDAVRERLGAGKGRPEKKPPLSPEAIEARKPPPPDAFVGAIQEPIQEPEPRVRKARVARRKKR